MKDSNRLAELDYVDLRSLEPLKSMGDYDSRMPNNPSDLATDIVKMIVDFLGDGEEVGELTVSKNEVMKRDSLLGEFEDDLRNLIMRSPSLNSIIDTRWKPFGSRPKFSSSAKANLTAWDSPEEGVMDELDDDAVNLWLYFDE